MAWSRKESASQTRSKQVLAVHTLVAKLAWLDGTLYWQEGRIAWRDRGRFVFGDASNISRAQRALNKFHEYKAAARQVLGDWESWVSAKRTRLLLAKALSQISNVPLSDLVARSQSRDGASLKLLVSWITVESMCANEMPCSPSAATVAAGEPAAGYLLAQCNDAGLPLESRMLSALVLGAIHKTNSDRLLSSQVLQEAITPKKKDRSAEAIRRAWEWGHDFGLSSEPSVIAALLTSEDGRRLALSYISARQHARHFPDIGKLARELLADRVPSKTVAAMAESFVTANQVAEWILSFKQPPSEGSFARRRQHAERDLARRTAAVATLVEILSMYAQMTRDPQAIQHATNFVRLALQMGPVSPEAIETILAVLREGTVLTPENARTYLELLDEKREILWDRNDIPEYRPGTEASVFASWFLRRWETQAKPLVTLMDVLPASAHLATAVDLRVHVFLGRQSWPDADMFNLMLAIIRDLNVTDPYGWVVRELHDALHCFDSATSARAAFKPLLVALAAIPENLRQPYLQHGLSSAKPTRKRAKEQIRVLARSFPIMANMTLGRDDVCVMHALLDSAFTIYDGVPEKLDEWLTWLANHIEQLLACESFHRPAETRLPLAVALGVALSDGDSACFQKMVLAGLRRNFAEHYYLFKSGIGVLKSLRVLHQPLAQLFPLQPSRCESWVVSLGLTPGLGADALKPLKLLENLLRGRVSVDEQWTNLLSRAPELNELVFAYTNARTIIGLGIQPPANVRQALNQQKKLSREHVYLEGLLKKNPGRADLRRRLDNLKSYLADESAIESHMLQLVKERLLRATVEAQMQAAEQQLNACFRAQLIAVTGRLPETLQFDRYLQNATLLIVDVIHNRRLMKQMLRAYINGDHEWIKRQPANQAFLNSLAARDVDVALWTAECSRRYRAPEVPGGTVHLFLETDPLRVLEMGNYFDTCLSFGRENSFSTVANACELNKRVAFAADGKGKIIGRKLIGIDEKGLMVGFKTYSSLPDGPGNKALRWLFSLYLSDFAARCGLSLADQGTVPTLLAESWYDDGTVPWKQDANDISSEQQRACSSC